MVYIHTTSDDEEHEILRHWISGTILRQTQLLIGNVQ